MILSDYDIMQAISGIGPKGDNVERLIIEPWPDDNAFQPASVELTLAPEVVHLISIGEDGEPVYVRAPFENDKLVIPPTAFLLGSTNETVSIPNWLVGQITGKSSLGRRGLSIHATAGFIDPGFRGKITLELKNDSGIPLTVTSNMRIGQLVLTGLSSTVMRPYGHPELGSHYQGQSQTTVSALKL